MFVFFVLLFAGAALFVFAATVFVFRRALLRCPPPDYAKKAVQKNTPVGKFGDRLAACAKEFDSRTPEKVCIQSYDGLQLHGRLFTAEEPRAVLLLLHGYHSCAGIDFGCAADFLLNEMHMHLLFAEQRTHGESEGEYITFGVRERFDCRDWAKYAAARFGEDLPILLYGLSMGGATVLMAAGLDLPGSVAGIVADCGFTTPRAIFTHVLQNGLHLPRWPFLPLFGLFCKWFAGFDMDGASAPEALANNDRPVLLIHGEDDNFVPMEMSLQNYAACRGEKMLLTVKGAAHGLSYLVEEAACKAEIAAFMELCLREKQLEMQQNL